MSSQGAPTATAAVVEVEVTDLPSELRVAERHRQAYVVVRCLGTPVGVAWLPVRPGGRVGGARELRAALAEAAGEPLRRRWLRERLGCGATTPAPPTRRPVTAAVCTRERPDDLRRCLEAFARLPGGGDELELLVVDNNPRTGDTLAVARDFAPRVRYVREDRPGLNAARNRALREARHDVVAFNDDDAVPEPGWPRALARHFDDPAVLCATGLTLPRELETPAQAWFESHCPFGRGFRQQDFDGVTCDPLLASRAGAGANMALRRDLPDLVGAFDEALDAGTPTRSGGDHEMFYRILSRGYRIVYDPEAVNWHRHRRTEEALRDALHGYGVGVYAFWTSCLLRDGEWRTLLLAAGWLFRGQLPGLARSLLRRPGALPPRFALGELAGCARGPGAYLRSRRDLAARSGQRTGGARVP